MQPENRFPAIVNSALETAGLAARMVQDVNEGVIYGSVNFGALTEPDGTLNQRNPLRLLNTPFGQSGADLGFAGALTYSETNMEQAGTINSKRAVIVRGYGVVVNGFPTYIDANGDVVDNQIGWNPRVLRDLVWGLVLSYKLGTRQEYHAGPIGLVTAAEYEPAATALSTTVNAQFAAAMKGGSGGLVRFDYPESLIAIKPNGTLQFNLTQYRPIVLTSDGEPWDSQNPTNLRISDARARVVLDVFDCEGVSN